jgi:alpha-mannosidase
MKFDELSVLIPCHNLDDFPTQLQGADAEGLLAAWSALWHPALIAAVGKAPGWRRAEFPSDSLFGKLLVVPPVVEKSFSGDLVAKAKNEGGLVIRGLTRRDEIVAALLAAIADGATSQATPIDAELVADFLALGTCYLYSELLVRRMRYVSTLDDGRIQEHLVAAAMAAVAGNRDEARRGIELCCNVLVESRGRFYPADTSLVDLTLVAATTMGPSLRREISRGQPLNLLISGELLAEMAAREPESLAMLRAALEIENPKISICGGEWREVELPLLPLESILAGLRRGLAVYQQHLGRQPAIFARRRYGLTPALPGILRGLGFRGAVHCTLDEGKFPQSDSTKTRWEGVDGAEIDAIGRVPLEAQQPGSFVQLAERIGHAMDHDHVATVCFAHWPSTTSPFYDDLRRITAIAPVFGKFVALDDYFAGTDQSGMYSRFTHDEYRAPYLQQAIATKQADPLSRWMRLYEGFSTATAVATLGSLASLLRGSVGADDVAEFAENSDAGQTGSEFAANSATSEVDAGRLAKAVARCASALPRGKGNAAPSYMLINPLSFSRRVLVELPKLTELPATQGPVKAVEQSGSGARAIVELPSLGFAWLGPTAGEAGRNWSGEPLASSQTLRNEHFEITIHPTTGGIQSLHDFRSRGNRLSQQLVYSAKSDEDSTSRMVADLIEVTDGGTLCGEITSRGQLLDANGKRIAGFVQRVQLTLGSRVATVEIELDPIAMPAADAWNSYFAVRHAWAD